MRCPPRSVRIARDDSTAASTVVELCGLGTLGLGGSNEPSLQWILDAHDVPVVVGDSDPTDSALPASPLLGQEISAQRFVRVAERPVTVEPLAVFGPQDTAGTVTRVGWYPATTPATDHALFSVPNDSYQSVAPSTPGSLSFDPGVAEFGLSSTWPFFGGRRVFSEDALNTWETVAANRHKVRVYPFRAPDGTVEPDAYVVAFQEHVSGYDYQDVRLRRAQRAAGGCPPAAQGRRLRAGLRRGQGTTADARTVTVTNAAASPSPSPAWRWAGPTPRTSTFVAAPADATGGGAGKPVCSVNAKETQWSSPTSTSMRWRRDDRDRAVSRLPVTDGTLNLAFTATVNQPTISAIERVPAAAATAPTAPQPLPTVLRFDTGGPAVTTSGAAWAASTGSCALVGGVATRQRLGSTLQAERRVHGAHPPRRHGIDGGGPAGLHVDVDGARRTTGLDIVARAGGQGRATWSDDEVNLTDGKLHLDRIRQVGQPLVNAVEMLDGH